MGARGGARERMGRIDPVVYSTRAPAARLAVALVVLLAAALAAPGGASAGLQTLNFDDRSAGSVVSSGPLGLTLPGNPIVFDAAGKTQSDPNALRMPGDCGVSSSTCATGDHLLELRFSSPARSVALRTGVVVPSTCFELDCPEVNLVGFDSEGVVRAATGRELLPHQSPITFPLKIDAFDHVITRAVLGVGEDPETGTPTFGSQWTAQIDNLAYDVLESDDPTPPPPPGPPSVLISGPSGDETFATTEVTVVGRVTAPAGLADFCAVANGASSFPSDCARTAAVRSDGTYSLSRIPGMRPGTNLIRVWARDTLRRTASASLTVEVADGDVDYRAETMEVTQVVQVEALPTPGSFSLPGVGPSARGETYAGVPLAAGKLTIVRLFGAVQGASSPVRGVTAQLHGFIRAPDGSLTRALGSPLRPHAGPGQLIADPNLPALRADPKGAYTFMLPPSWTRSRRELVLRGEIAPSTITTAARECCRVNNSFWADGIRFTSVRPLTVLAVGLTYTNPDGSVVRPPNPLPSYFDDFQAVWPGRTTIVNTGREIDLTEAVDDPDVDARDEGNRLLYEMYEDARPAAKVVGLSEQGIGGGKGPGPTAATSAIDAGLDFMAHETGHAIGLAHAHSPANRHDGDSDPPDHTCAAHDGAINGVGIDPRIWSGPEPGTFSLISVEKAGVFDAEPDASDAVYDYMSYCSNEGAGRTWVATGYWANQVRELVPDGRLITDFTRGCCFLGAAADPTVRAAGRPAGRQGKAPIVRVGAVLGGDGRTTIGRVEPDRGTPDPPAPGSGVTVVLRDRSGAEISRTAVVAQISEERPAPGRPSSPDSRLVNAAVPGAGAARVEIEVAGVVVASRQASANAPRAKLRRPRKGARIGAKGTFPVRWTANDADGDQLQTKIQFSADRGRSWQTLALGRSGTRARIRGSLLPRTRKGMLRVLVSDGFNVTGSVVKRIRAAGGRPQVDITTPAAKRTKLLGDTVMVLEGSVVDAIGQPLRGKRLVWRSKGRRLGSGEQIGVPAHRLGRKVILVARDRAGNRGKDTVRFKVRKVKPLFTTLAAKPLAKRSRKLRLRVASTLPGRVIVKGAGLRRTRARLGERPRTVVVRTVGKRRKAYTAKLKLKSGGRATRERLVVNRR